VHRILVCILLSLPLAAAGGRAAEGSWSYRVGETRTGQQGNFCARQADAREIAAIFRRFGAPTGFAALSNAPGCFLAVHDTTPRGLLDAVRVDLQDGGHYVVRFISVDLDGDTPAVLITTRGLLEH
jgi:hypothetical protein